MSMRPPTLFERLGDQYHRVPEALRPAMLGAGAIWFLFGARGGIVALPVIVILVFATSHSPFADVGRVVIVLGLMTLGGALAGMAHAHAGRRLRRLPLGGYLDACLTVSPYVAIVIWILRIVEQRPTLVAPERAEWIAFAICVPFFGAILTGFLED